MSWRCRHWWLGLLHRHTWGRKSRWNHSSHRAGTRSSSGRTDWSRLLAWSSSWLRTSSLLWRRLVRRIVSIVGNLGILGRVQACEIGRLRLIGADKRRLGLVYGSRLVMLRHRSSWSRLRLRLHWLYWTRRSMPRIMRLGLLLASIVWLLTLILLALDADSINWKWERLLLDTVVHRKLVCLVKSIPC